MLTETEERQLRNELDYYKRAFESARAQLDKMPKQSFIALTLESVKGQSYQMDIKMYINDHTPVRINNHLLDDYRRLCEIYTGGKCEYIEEGIRKDYRK